MNVSEMIQSLVGECINSETLGKGLIIEAKQKKADVHISIQFNDESESIKTYSLQVASNKRLFSFDIPEIEKKVETILESMGSYINEASADDIGKTSEAEYTDQLVLHILKGESIGFLLTDLFSNSAFEISLFRRAFTIIEGVMDGNVVTDERQRAVVVLALTFLGMKYYDGDLHGHIAEKYREIQGRDEYEYSRISLQNAVYKILGDYRDKAQYFDKHSYVAVPLVFCCVPHYRLGDLFVIAYDIYQKNLLFDEDLTDEQITTKVLEVLNALKRKDLISDSEVIKGTGYLMSKYTQSCIYSGCGIEDLANIIAHCIRLIIFHLSRPEDSFIVEPYYSEGYERWVNVFESDTKKRQGYENNRTISRPYFRLINQKVYVITGEYSMDDAKNPNAVHIILRNQGEEYSDLWLNDPGDIDFDDSENALGGYVINRKEIEVVGNPLDSLSYVIVCDGEELYDSRERLWRGAIFFDGHGNEIKPGTSYDGEIFAVTHTDNKDEYDDCILTISNIGGCYLSSLEVNSRDVFRFDNIPYVFYRIVGSKIIGYQIPWLDFVSADTKTYPVYSDLSILLQASCNKENVVVSVDGKEYSNGSEGEVRYRVKLFSNEYDGNWAYLLTISDMPEGYHNIKVVNALTKKQIKGANYNIIFDALLWKSYVGKTDDAISYELCSSFFDKQVIDFKYGLSHIRLDFFVRNLGYGYARVFPTAISYSVDGNVWSSIDVDLPLYEIPEQVDYISICGPSGITAYVYNEEAAVKKQYLSVAQEESPYTYRMGINYLRTITDRNKARIIFVFGNRSKYFHVRFYPFVNREKCLFWFDEQKGKHLFKVFFEGNSKVNFVVKPLNEDSVIVSQEIHSGDIVELYDSVISKRVKYLSVSLCGKKYNSIFDEYQSEPFITFPKYNLSRPISRVNNDLSVFKVNKQTNTIDATFVFEGADTATVELCPSWKNDAIERRTVANHESICFNLAHYSLDSYKLVVYFDENYGNSNDSNRVPDYISKTLYSSWPVLRQRYHIESLIYKNGNKVKNDYNIYMVKNTYVAGKYYILCKMFNNEKGVEIDDILVLIEKNEQQAIRVRLRKFSGDRAVYLKHNGEVIDKAYLTRWEKDYE